MHRYWPLFDLRLTTADLELRPMTETDQLAVADVLPADVELDPAATTYGLDQRTGRGIVAHQDYWKAYGSWRPDAWRLKFAVMVASEVVGAQELEAKDFPTLRTVETASFLVPGFRGRGLGKQMRAAVLQLAFGPLEAQAAVTEAWHDNHASLGVSRALGYRPNGESLHRRGEGVDTMVGMRLRRADWVTSGSGAQVEISDFESCRPLFGLAPADAEP